MAKHQFSVIKEIVAKVCGMDLSDSVQETTVERWINDTLDEVNGLSDWYWLYDHEFVQTVVDKTAGTVSIAAGGTTVTGVGTAFAAGDVGKFIRVSSSDDWYEIIAVASTLSCTISPAYVGTSALSAGTYKIRKMFYSCSSDVELILTAKQAITPAKLTVIHSKTMDDYEPDVTDTGKPTVLYTRGFDSSGNVRFSLFPTPNSVLNIQFWFKKRASDLSGDTDKSDLPEKWNNTVLVEGAIWRGHRYNRDQREQAQFLFYRDSRNRMLGQAELTVDWHPIFENVETQGEKVEISWPSQFER